MFFAYKKLLDRTEMRTRDRIYAFSRYGQFETSPEKIDQELIDQELRTAVCERRQTNYSIDVTSLIVILSRNVILSCLTVHQLGLCLGWKGQ